MVCSVSEKLKASVDGVWVRAEIVECSMTVVDPVSSGVTLRYSNYSVVNYSMRHGSRVYMSQICLAISRLLVEACACDQATRFVVRQYTKSTPSFPLSSPLSAYIRSGDASSALRARRR